MLLSCCINLIKFEKNLLFKIFEMTYNLKRREYLVIKYYVRAYRPSEMDGLPRYYDIRGWCNRSRGIDSGTANLRLTVRMDPCGRFPYMVYFRIWNGAPSRDGKLLCFLFFLFQ